MGKCEYSFYDAGDRCRIKAGVPGESSDRVGQDTYRSFCTYTDGHKKCPFFLAFQKTSTQSGGCYLTSACVRARDLPDDCAELTVLRAFRDGWLRQQPFGAACISEYYRTAPAIVESIDARPEREHIYSQIYEKVVAPCVALVRSGAYEQAFSLYRDAALALNKAYGR